MRGPVLIILGTAVLMLGQDVEREPVVIEAPVPPPPPESPDVIRPDNPEPAREKMNFPVPRRIRLELSRELFPPPVEPPAQSRQGPSEAELVKRRIDGFFEDVLARHRAVRGNVDPGFRNLERRMDYFFRPDFKLINDPAISEISGAWLKKEFWNWLSDWYRQASRTGSHDYRLEETDQMTASLTGLMDLQRWACRDDGYGSMVTTLVEVRIDVRGHLTAELLGSSGHPRFDEEAMQAVEKAIRTPFRDQLPPGPARSRYAVSARYAILPPVPVVGFSFDILLGHFDLMYPMKKMIQKRVRLVAVYRDEPGEKNGYSPDSTP